MLPAMSINYLAVLACAVVANDPVVLAVGRPKGRHYDSATRRVGTTIGRREGRHDDRAT